VRIHSDNRRSFYGDIFNTTGGDINIVYLEKGVPIGWHRHWYQDDHIFLVSGALKVQIISDAGRNVWELRGSEKLTYIPRGLWHGYEALEHGTILLQFNAPSKWDGTDEERQEIGEGQWAW
jgi:quercetin dioxygenase-like cupin family protein